MRADGSPQVRCDFGAHLGVQSVAEGSCEYVPDSSGATCVEEDPPAMREGAVGTHTIMMEPGTSRGYTAPPGWELSDTDSEHDWDLALSDCGTENGGLSMGESDIDPHQDDPVWLLGELGEYPNGPKQEDEDLDAKYAECNWHAKRWSLLPRHAFTGKTPGPTDLLGEELLEPVEYFFRFWDETLQRKIVWESNDYANYVDPATGERKGGEVDAKPITLEEFRQFTGICCLMGVRKQSSLRDY